MSAKSQLVRAILPRYLKATRLEKSAILDEFCANTGYARQYAIAKLKDYQRHPPLARERRVPRRRGQTYGPECVAPLARVWELLDRPCGTRLAPYLPVIIPKLEACGELTLEPAVREKLLVVSKNTVDRLLAPERRRSGRKGQATTKPGSILKHQIPVRSEPWPVDTPPGYCELDYVAHCGEVNAGDYVSTLSFTDLATTWVEHAAVLGKGQARTVDAVAAIAGRLPFPLRGIDPDNDGQFITYLLRDWCAERDIAFTRSRPYHKNDNAHIEQKNWTTVRQVLGYRRIDTPAQCRRVRHLYAGPLRDWQNFFQPTLQLAEKVRRGSRVTKRYGRAQTPYARVLASEHVSPRAKRRLREHYQTLNPVTLKRQIDAMVKQILN